jgi:hypothetical protein
MILRYAQFLAEKKDPCWTGYKQIGTKKKRGKVVPRCVPVKENMGPSTLSDEQIEWLNECTVGSWTLNPQTGLVDVDGDFDCSRKNLTDFKGVRFGVVTGYFACSVNNLTSLDGAPQSVGGKFSCNNNQLTSLKGAPQSVGGYFTCSSNNLTSLDGAPQKIKLSFYCTYNKLTSLEGGPMEVSGNYSCYNNSIVSLEGAPKYLGGRFEPGHNNQVSERTLRGIYKKMQEGLSFPDALAKYWRHIRNEEDKIQLAKYNPSLPDEEKEGYAALSKFRGRVI